jgi:hypothetical protein
MRFYGGSMSRAGALNGKMVVASGDLAMEGRAMAAASPCHGPNHQGHASFPHI